MYVNAGSWPMSSVDSKGGLRGASSKRHHVTQRMSVDSDGKLSYAAPGAKAGDPSDDGFWAQVAKTTDGGATWSLVLDDSTSGFYPNDMDCFDEDHCAMAVEGADASGAVFGAIMTTSDGGANWATTDTSMSMAMMGAKMRSATEAWGAGSSSEALGAFFQTTDGGATWDQATTDPNDKIAEMTAIDFDGNGDAWGTGMKRTQNSCIVHAVSS